ncbi:hypothetical protein IV203_026346 [Nitzschia inconspicua]|uniref:Uncharacterized protein n=1 Tax=Nitzschia inconspicua TaxID=303405 RepID=A0A9K3LM50_9STRA|nr:hypothetical protein IV203_026346 [Nitzschia inconspicua]
MSSSLEGINATMEDPAAKAAEAEEARKQAEARRKRILEKADRRMGVVSGEQVQDEAVQKTNTSNAARMRAARQRRYGKKTNATTPPDDDDDDKNNDNNITVEKENDGGDTKETESNKEGGDDPTTMDAANITIKPDPPVVQASQPESSKAQEHAEKTSASTDAAGEKKKYMGVAKMRRKMVAKKKMEEGEGETNAYTANPTAAVDAAIASDPAVAKVMEIQKVPKFPIYMHIIIVILLFVAGLDVGIQQFHDDVVVHTETAIQEYGLPFVHRKPWEVLVPKEKNTKRALLEEELLSSLDGNGPRGVDPDAVSDEFVEVLEEEEYVPNIDPLFGVDFDEMTKGPGIFNQMARGAIAIHRMILWMLYYTPLRMYNALLSIPASLMKMPPTLFLIALVLRQIVGKIILGAHIPDANTDGPEEKNNIEVIGMAKNFVKNFFVTNFPTLVWAYDVFVHLRSDMYIVLCGVFCGMAWSHLTLPREVMDGSTETIDGMADEL